LDKELQSSSEANTSFAEFLHKRKVSKPERNAKPVANNQSILSQFDNYCTEMQPCTCYYPDHPNVTIFELGTDLATQRASGINGTGPGNCEDLQDSGYSLKGFYMVRFNLKRVKTIYCEFNEIKKNKNNKTKRIKRSSKAIPNKTPKPKRLRLCGGVGPKPCTFYYSDNPDAPLTGKRLNDSVNYNSKVGPKSCEDLEKIGHFIEGFYMVRFNAIKVKTFYCQFNKGNLKIDKKKLKIIQSPVEKNGTGAISRVSRFCQGIGSQPCSCYSTNYPNILQFELSSDEITRNASRENGMGPESCKDLQKHGHSLKGFYMVRYKVKIMKIIFCNFDEENKGSKVARKPTKARHISKVNELFPIKGLPESTQREEEITTKKSAMTSTNPYTKLESNGK